MLRQCIPGRAIFPLLAALFVMLIAGPAHALNTGTLRVTVTDEMGLAMPGADLELTGENLIGGAQMKKTDANGEQQFNALPPGTYTLNVTKPGFNTQTLTNISVQVGRTAEQRVVLKEGNLTEVEAVGNRAIDVNSTTQGEVLTNEVLNRLPTGRSYQSAISATAGVTGQGGNKNLGGGASNENTYMLDGANITDPVTGTFSANFNYDAIEQIEVILGGYMPEYGQSLGGIVNIVTQSGSNNLEFRSNVYYSNSNWRPRMDDRYSADGFRLAPTGFDSTSEILQIASTVLGPVVKDKAWFIISYQHTRSIIANTGIPQTRDFDGHYLLTKLTVQPTSEHRFALSGQLDPTTIDNIDQGDPYQKPEAQGRQAQGGYIFSGKWQWFLSPNVDLDTTVTTQKTYIEVGAVPCTHDDKFNYHPCEPGEQQGNVDWETPGRIGVSGAYNSINYGYFYFDDRIRYNAQSNLSLNALNDRFGGKHDVKIGIGTEQLIWDQIQGYAGNSLYVDLNDIPFDPNTFQAYYWIEISGPIKFRTSGSKWNAFIQDSWKPVNNLTVNYGLRYDNFVWRNDLGIGVLQGQILGPRLFAAWDPWGDQKTKVATGYGRFNDTGRLGTASALSAAAYGSKYYYAEYLTNFSYGFPEGYLNYSGQALFDSPIENTTVANSALRAPRVDEMILNLEREVIEDVAVFSNLSTKFVRHQYEYDDTNLIWDSDGSAVIGSRIGINDQYRFRVRTPVLAKRDYLRWDLGFRKVLSRRWQGQLTYSYTNHVGSTNAALSGSFINGPQTQYNYGPLLTDLTHVVKAYGFWDLPTDPWTQTFGILFEYYGGLPEERLYYAENPNGSGFGGYSLRIRDRGSYWRFNPYYTLGVRFQQTIDVRKGDLIIDLEARNITNARAPDVYNFGFLDQLNRLQVISRQDPLQFTAGLRYQF